MATQANPLPGTQITGDETKDLELLVRNAVAEAYKELNPDNTQKPDNSGSQKIKIPVFGQEREFNSFEEAGKAIEEALAEVQQRTAQQLQTQTTKTEEKPPAGFDREKFAEMVGNDPLKGLEYALGHMFFDGQVTEGVGSLIKQRLQDAEASKRVLAAYQFREMVPGLQVDQASLQKLDQIRQSLGLPPDNAQAWEAAYSVGVMRGILPPPKREQTQQQQQSQQPSSNFQRQTNDPPTLPYLGRSGTDIPPGWEDTIRKAEALPADKLEAAILALAGGNTDAFFTR